MSSSRTLSHEICNHLLGQFSKHCPQFSSVSQSCPTLCSPMDCSTPGLPVHHQLLELAQTHVHRVGDAIQPSHPLSSPSPPAFNLSQHQGLFQWVSSLHLPYSLNNFPATNSPPKICSLAINLLAAFKVEFSITPLLQNYTALISIPIKIFLNKLSLTI